MIFGEFIEWEHAIQLECGDVFFLLDFRISFKSFHTFTTVTEDNFGFSYFVNFSHFNFLIILINY